MSKGLARPLPRRPLRFLCLRSAAALSSSEENRLPPPPPARRCTPPLGESAPPLPRLSSGHPYEAVGEGGEGRPPDKLLRLEQVAYLLTVGGRTVCYPREKIPTSIFILLNIFIHLYLKTLCVTIKSIHFTILSLYHQPT